MGYSTLENSVMPAAQRPRRTNSARWLLALPVAAAIAVGGFAGPASATVIIETGGGNFPGDSNIIFNACDGGAVTGPALTVTGCLNSDHSYYVDFTSTENLVADGGQALVQDAALDGFSFLEISTQEGSFATFITDINATPDGITGQPNDGTVEITPFIGGVAQPTQTFAMSESGSNFFRIATDNSDVFSSIQFQAIDVLFSNIEFADFRQNRLGPADDPTVGDPTIPEPGTLGPFAVGMIAFGVLNRRRHRRDHAA